MEDDIALAFIFLIDGIKRFRYMVIVTIVCLGILVWIWHVNDDAEKSCRAKGGTAINTESGVTCVSGVIK